jgi:hypothetical protein
MADLVETIQLRTSAFVIIQGEYDLTADALRDRNRRSLVAGDDYTFEFTLVESDGTTPRDISAATIRFTAKYKPTDADPGIVQISATIVDGPTGRFDVILSESDVAGPQAIRGLYDIQMTIAGDTETLIHGDIEWAPNITVTTP